MNLNKLYEEIDSNDSRVNKMILDTILSGGETAFAKLMTAKKRNHKQRDKNKQELRELKKYS